MTSRGNSGGWWVISEYDIKQALFEVYNGADPITVYDRMRANQTQITDYSTPTKRFMRRMLKRAKHHMG